MADSTKRCMQSEAILPRAWFRSSATAFPAVHLNSTPEMYATLSRHHPRKVYPQSFPKAPIRCVFSCAWNACRIKTNKRPLEGCYLGSTCFRYVGKELVEARLPGYVVEKLPQVSSKSARLGENREKFFSFRRALASFRRGKHSKFYCW